MSKWVCQNQKKGMMVLMPGRAGQASERKAYGVEIDCLQKKLSGSMSCNECWSPIHDRIEFLKQQRDKY